jgi:hypothetical protein
MDDPLKEVFDQVQNSLHVAERCMRGAGTIGRGKLTSILSEGAERFPSEWHDEIVTHTIRRNDDGSLTAIILVNIYGDKGERWTVDRVIRLERTK